MSGPASEVISDCTVLRVISGKCRGNILQRTAYNIIINAGRSLKASSQSETQTPIAAITKLTLMTVFCNNARALPLSLHPYSVRIEDIFNYIGKGMNVK